MSHMRFRKFQQNIFIHHISWFLESTFRFGFCLAMIFAKEETGTVSKLMSLRCCKWHTHTNIGYSTKSRTCLYCVSAPESAYRGYAENTAVFSKTDITSGSLRFMQTWCCFTEDTRSLHPWSYLMCRDWIWKYKKNTRSTDNVGNPAPGLILLIDVLYKYRDVSYRTGYAATQAISFSSILKTDS